MQDKMIQDAVADSMPSAAAETVVEGDGELDPQVVMLALAVGGQVLDYIVRGDDEGLSAFFGQITAEIQKQKRLMRLLQMEQSDLEKVLSQLDQTQPSVSESVPENPPAVENVQEPVQKLFTPAERVGKGKASDKRRLWDYVQGV